MGVALATAGAPGQAGATEADAEGIAFFEKNIRPVLVENCYKCHSAEARDLKGDLFLDSKQGMLNGGESGPAIVPGQPFRSRLLRAIRRSGELKMPPKSKLPKRVVLNFTRWIKMGAPDPRSTERARPVKQSIDFEESRKFWSFVKPTQPSVPEIGDTAWPSNEIDHFILAKLEQNKLTPVRDASRRELIRRASFDLTGLPPTPEQVTGFLNDPSEDAFEKVIDELLKSPHFGEQWGRHWLDVARYSESNGMERNYTYPHAWRYRDYVIESFNRDKPFDQFVKEQVAGDLLGRGKRPPTDEQLIATGFLAIGPKPLNQGNDRLFSLEVIDEQIDATTRAFLGLTVACARCHDHKFDPIPTEDYYAMAGIFRSTDTLYGTANSQGNRQPADLHTVAASDDDRAERIRRHNSELRKAKRRLNGMRDEIEELRGKRRSSSDDKASLRRLNRNLKTLQANVTDLEEKEPGANYAMGVRDGKISDVPVLIHGEIRNRGNMVERGFPQILGHVKSYPIGSRSSGRLQLASWITQDDNPLTSRVMANRIWKHLLGTGLVRTLDNFGSTGTAPTHPGLLDHLALRFVGNGWSVKSLIREIMLSRTYQLSNDTDDTNAAIDPGNRLLWRMNHKRLSAEALRDAMLATSGRLNPRPADGSLVAKLGDVNVGRALRELAQLQRKANDHRSVYLPVMRNAQPEMMRIFDAAEPSLIVGRRNETTVPTQALYLMNNSFVVGQAYSMAKRVMDDTESNRDGIRLAYKLAFAREADDDEITKAQKFMASASGEKDRPGQWTLLCQALLASAEFRYID